MVVFGEMFGGHSLALLSANLWYGDSGGSYQLSRHCVSQSDSLTIVLTGGLGSGSGASQKTYFYPWFNYNAASMVPGPDMISKRYDHGCSFITGKDGNPTAIVAGGKDSTGMIMKTVEIFNRALNKWESGPDLPAAVYGFTVSSSSFLTFVVYFGSPREVPL